MVEYLVVALQHPSGGWVAVLPDFIGVTGRAVSMQHAVDRATAGAREVCGIVAGIRKAMPQPCDLATAQMNLRWSKEYGIDWQKAVVQSVRLSYPSVSAKRAPKRESKVVEWSRRAAARRGGQEAPPVAAE